MDIVWSPISQISLRRGWCWSFSPLASLVLASFYARPERTLLRPATSSPCAQQLSGKGENRCQGKSNLPSGTLCFLPGSATWQCISACRICPYSGLRKNRGTVLLPRRACTWVTSWHGSPRQFCMPSSSTAVPRTPTCCPVPWHLAPRDLRGLSASLSLAGQRQIPQSTAQDWLFRQLFPESHALKSHLPPGFWQHWLACSRLLP